MTENPIVAFRKSVRLNIKQIMEFIELNYIRRENDKAVKQGKPICMFCGSSGPITKEHIIPRWVFQNDTKRFFTITLNGHNQTYNQSTVSACQKCNSALLNHLERKIQILFKQFDPQNKTFSDLEMQDLILWLEVIDYKFHILNISKRFLSRIDSDHVPYLKDFPLYMLLPEKDYSPKKVLTEIRKTLYRLSVKDKKGNINSIIIFKTNNKTDHFFHTLNDFIFLELARYGIAIFYFYNRTFNDKEKAYKASMEIIKEVY